MTESYQKSPEHTQDSIAAILERANQKLKQEITPIESLTHRQAILEQRIRLLDEALKKFATQQLRLGTNHISKEDLQKLLTAASIHYNPHDSEDELRSKVNNFLSSL